MSKDIVHVQPMDLPDLGRLDWALIATEVRQYKGQWCRVPKPMNPTVAIHIKRGKYPHIPPEEFEVTTRQAEGDRNRSWIFLRAR